jgi:hypothetical protein
VKWIAVRVKKTRQNIKLEPGSDSIRAEKALAPEMLNVFDEPHSKSSVAVP